MIQSSLAPKLMWTLPQLHEPLEKNCLWLATGSVHSFQEEGILWGLQATFMGFAESTVIAIGINWAQKNLTIAVA